MKETIVRPGDSVTLKTKETEWKGTILESYDSEITLLKLDTGYNIGVRNSEVTSVVVRDTVEAKKSEPIKQKKNKDLRNVAMIVTGGTISARLDPKTGGVTWTTVDELFKIAPEITEICNVVEVIKPFLKGSADMSLKYWKEIAKTAHEFLVRDDIDGVIITHGTDTMHYGACALSFFISDLNKPIAFTYSQRSIDRASTDAHLNLLCAAKFAVSDIAEVAVIGHKNLHDESCLAITGTKARKMHTSRRDAFKSVNAEPLAEITKDHVEVFREFNARSDKTPKLDTKYSDKVALIKPYPGQDPEILDYYAQKGYKGLVIEAAGLGHLPGKGAEKSWLTTLKKLVKDGMIICAVPTTLYGSLNPNVYGYGRDLQKTGIIHLKDILPETAFVKLSWIMGHKSWVYNDKSAGEKMLKNYAHEFNDSLKLEFEE